MAKSLGNDVASYQGDINFDTYKNNANFIIVKSSEGVGFIDPKFSRNQSEARRVGLPIGYYHFARPDLGNSPEAEADYFLKVVGSPVEGEVYVLDYEPKSNPGDPVAWCKRFLDRIYTAIGVKPLIYLNQSQTKGFNWSSVIDAGYGLWIASYTYDPNNNTAEIGKWPFAAIQQWTNKQQVPGIPAVADGDVFFGDIPTFKKYGYKKPATNPPTNETEIQQLRAEIAKQTTRAEKAEATVQTLTTQNTEKDEIIKQFPAKIEQETSKAKEEALEKFRSVAAPYLYYKIPGKDLMAFGVEKITGKDITPTDLPEELKGGDE